MLFSAMFYVKTKCRARLYIKDETVPRIEALILTRQSQPSSGIQGGFLNTGVLYSIRGTVLVTSLIKCVSLNSVLNVVSCIILSPADRLMTQRIRWETNGVIW